MDFVSPQDIKITDTVFDGVEVRVYQPPAKQGEGLKRSVVYIHGGGWALARASMCLTGIKEHSSLALTEQENTKAARDGHFAKMYLNSAAAICSKEGEAKVL